MINSFKNYINTLLCLGIFVTILQLVIPKNNSRKYIYSLVGIIMIISVISPVINLLKNENIEDSVNQVISNIDAYKIEDDESDYKLKEANEELIKDQVISNIKNDIVQKLNEKGIKTKNIEVYLEDNYEVKKIRINIESLNKDSTMFSNLNKIVTYISENYQINYEKIEVVEEG